MLRTDVLALLLFERLSALGACSEAEALDVLDSRAPGRAHEIIDTAAARGMVRRVQRAGEPVSIEAAGYASRRR